MSRIALGTAQLGQRYGIANHLGIPAADEAAAILRCAAAAGSDTIDTAMAYGDSEAVLGRAGVAAFDIVTKLPPLANGAGDVEVWVRAQLQDSLARLRVPKVRGLLLHRSTDLAGPGGAALRDVLKAVKHEGLVERIGISVYGPDEVLALDGVLQLDIVQAPYNLLDRRFERSGCFERLRRAGTEIHARSAFLQGLLLLPRSGIPAAFAAWRQVLDRYHDWLDGQQTSALDACLGFALGNDKVDKVVVGVESAAQLREIYASAGRAGPAAPAELETDDLDLVNPANWKRA